MSLDETNSTEFEDHEDSKNSYYLRILLYAVVGIFFYYLGSFLLIFIRNIDGVLSGSTPVYEISWKLAFENFPLLVRNIYNSFFGYFEEYGRLYNRDTTFLIPIDLGVKMLLVGYFWFFWMPWDTNRCYKWGYFNKDYPYILDDVKDKLLPQKDTKIDKNSQPQSNLQTTFNHNSPMYSQYEQNPYFRAQILRNQSSIHLQEQVDLRQQIREEQDEDEDDEDRGIMLFDGIHKPLEEAYQKYEKVIYDIIRKRVLPGSNILLVAYFSTLFIVDFGRPISVIGYTLGIMSMFWCIQSFMMILDHTQFPPE